MKANQNRTRSIMSTPAVLQTRFSSNQTRLIDPLHIQHKPSTQTVSYSALSDVLSAGYR
jgi:hypothetical protein